METEFFQHGGKGNRHVWLGRAVPHPLLDPSSQIPAALSLPLLSHQSGLCAFQPGALLGKVPSRVAKAPFNSVTSSAKLAAAGPGPARPGVLGTCRS